MKRYILAVMALAYMMFSPWVYSFFQLQWKYQELDEKVMDIFPFSHTLVTSVLLFVYFRIIIKISNDSKTELEVHFLKKTNDIASGQKQQLEELQTHEKEKQEIVYKKLLHLQECIQKKDLDKIAIEMDSLSKYCSETRLSKFCSNSLLNAILLGKKAEAEKKNIQIEFQIFLPDTVQLPDTLVTALFSNLLDNGIEACIEADMKSPFLSLKVEYRSGFLHIKMVNSKNADQHFDHSTTKKDSYKHGFGLKIIEEIIEENDGMYEWLNQGDTFESLLMLRV